MSVVREQSGRWKVSEILARLAVGALLAGAGPGHGMSAQEAHDIMVGSSLVEGYDMGVNSSGGHTDWLAEEGGYFKAAYPSGQNWGAVFITVGPPKDPPRPSRDLSMYNTLSIEMKGEQGGEIVFVGIKTNEQPDDGRETKIRTTLTDRWRPYEYNLRDFRGADPRILYVVTELVFDGRVGQTVYCRNIRYLSQ